MIKIENDHRMLKEIVVKTIDDARSEVNEIKKPSATKADKDFHRAVLLGLYFALSNVQSVLTIWHPHDTDEELRQVFAAFGADVDLDELCLNV